MPITRDLVRLHRHIIQRDINIALDLTVQASHLPGITHFAQATVYKPSIASGKPFFPMRFATKEQAKRGKCQAVNVMHISNHIESYEIFREELDREEEERRMEGGRSAKGEDGGSGVSE